MTASPRLPDGVFAACLTPQHDDDLRIDIDALIEHARWLLASGCNGIALFGTTGEANSFSLSERMDALDAVLAAGLPAHRLMVGNGCCALPDTVALTRHAVACDVGGVLMLPPFYYKNVRDEGVYAAFDQVIQQVGNSGLKVYLYHFPQMSGVAFSNPVVERLLAAYPDTIVGMKDSSGDWAHMEHVARAFPGFRVFAGTERYLLDMLKAGGAGCITATANVTAPLAGAVFARWQAEDVQALQDRLTTVRAAIEIYPAIPALKCVMAEMTGRTTWLNLRPPLAPLHDDEAILLLEALHQLDFLTELSGSM